jgi:hypothetical protein
MQRPARRGNLPSPSPQNARHSRVDCELPPIILTFIV